MPARIIRNLLYIDGIKWMAPSLRLYIHLVGDKILPSQARSSQVVGRNVGEMFNVYFILTPWANRDSM